MTFHRIRVVASSYALHLCLVASLILTHPSLTWASSIGPFGAGLPDGGGVPGASYFPRLVGYLIWLQVYFDQTMTAAVRAMHHDGSAVWTLLALSFAYGVIHAAGPGHGKAVVSSYLLATRQTLRNGITLAFVASLAQAAGAIALILIASLALHMTSVSITLATFKFEIVSDILIMLLGCWLIWTKIVRPARLPKLPFEPINPLARLELYQIDAGHGRMPLFRAHGIEEMPKQVDVTSSPVARGISLSHDQCGCCNHHMPNAADAEGTLDWRKAWTVVASTALRPCTGALIVLVFSISQKLLLAGIAATLVMGLGTAITVAVLAILTVSARKTAVVLTRVDSPLGRKLVRAAEACGALAVFVFGTLLFVGNIFFQY